MDENETGDRLARITIRCDAPFGLFLEWKDVPEEIKAELDKNGPIPCEGTGNLGWWCLQCRFKGADLEKDDGQEDFN